MLYCSTTNEYSTVTTTDNNRTLSYISNAVVIAVAPSTWLLVSSCWPSLLTYLNPARVTIIAEGVDSRAAVIFYRWSHTSKDHTRCKALHAKHLDRYNERRDFLGFSERRVLVSSHIKSNYVSQGVARCTAVFLWLFQTTENVKNHSWRVCM